MLPNTDRTSGPLGRIHDAFVRDDSSIEWTIDPDAYEPREVERGRRSWVLRMLDEYRSMVSFTGLVAELASIQAPLDVVGAATRVVRDEVRHVDLCRRMMDALGGIRGDADEPRWIRQDPSRPTRLRVLRTLVGSLAIGETASAAMIAGVRADASDPTARAVLGQMLGDESFHGRFGFFALDALWPARTPEEERDVFAMLPKALAGVERACVGTARPGPYRPSPFGSMSAEARRDAFYDCVRDRILPELEARGLPANAAWKSRAKTA